MYVCPLCGSGTGKNKTGAFSIFGNDPTRWTCFACERYGDIFDLVGYVENLEGFEQQSKRVEELFNVELSIQNPKPKKKTEKKQTRQNYTEYYKESNKYLNKVLTNANQKTFREISIETLNRFNVGLAKDPQRIVIPLTNHSYTERFYDAMDTRYKNTGGKDLFNSDSIEGLSESESPLFVVEGEFDAMSIVEAGGDKVRVVGLGSATNGNALLKALVEELQEKKPNYPIVLLFDRDNAGQEAQKKLEIELNKRGYAVATPEILKEIEIKDDEGNVEIKSVKDPNDILKLEGGKEILKERLEDFISNIKTTEELYRETATDNYIEQFKNGISESVNTPAISTSFENLDESLDGGLYEGLYIVGAISSLGKTTLVTQIADQIAQNEQDVLIFSLEMARTEIMAKSISRNTAILDIENDFKNAKTTRGITAGRLYNAYSEQEKNLIGEAIGAYSNYAKNIYIREGLGDIGVEQVRKVVEDHVNFTGNKPVVIIDYLQILSPYNEKSTDKQNTDKAVLELKRISRDFKIPVIAISSFNRDNYNNEVSMVSFKESGAIEYSSDVLIGLQFKKEMTFNANDKEEQVSIDDLKKRDPRQVELKILKNRNGRTGDKLYFEFRAKFNLFSEVKNHELVVR